MRNLFRILSRTASVAALVVVAAATALGQGSNGTLSGRANDQTGAGLPGVTVTATSPSTGFTRTDTTVNEGAYTLASIPAGTYTVTFALSGFKTIEQKNVEVNVASTRTLDVTMQVSAVAEMITVSTEAPL